MGRERRCARRLLSVALLLAALVTAAAAAPARATGGLQVSGSIFNQAVQPGETYEHVMTVSIPADSPPMSISVQAMGMGQGLDGAVQPLAAGEDRSPFSALPYIVAIDRPQFRLEPGGSQEVRARITLPGDLGADGRYAVIHIGSEPTSGSRVAFAVAVNVPIILSPAGAARRETGAITVLEVQPVRSGEPIVVETVLTNTGNHHFKAYAEVRILDDQGSLIVERVTPVSDMSIVPTFARRFLVSFGLLDRPQGLAAGTYTVESRVVHEGGAVLDSRQTTFEVAAPYRPFAELADQDVFIKAFAGEEPGCVDARPVAPLEVCFEETGIITGTVAVGRYRQAPAVGAGFGRAEAEGGTGKVGAGFTALRVDGFDAGRVRSKWYYEEHEIEGLSPNSLFLAYWNGSSWLRLEDMAVYPGAAVVEGEMRVASLVRAPVLGLGGDRAGSLSALLQGQNPLILGAAGVIVALLVVVIILLLRRGIQPRALSSSPS